MSAAAVGLPEIQIGTEVIKRLPCPACFGGGTVAGGNTSGYYMKRCAEARSSAVGTCLRCDGTCVECAEDYRERVLSLLGSANRAHLEPFLESAL